MSVEQVTKNNWADMVIQNEQPVLVKFGAPWCGPCKMLAPTLDNIATARDDVVIVEVNIDDADSQGLAQQYNVRGVPTMVLFKGGNDVARKVGIATLPDINAFINENI